VSLIESFTQSSKPTNIKKEMNLLPPVRFDSDQIVPVCSQRMVLTFGAYLLY